MFPAGSAKQELRLGETSGRIPSSACSRSTAATRCAWTSRASSTCTLSSSRSSCWPGRRWRASCSWRASAAGGWSGLLNRLPRRESPERPGGPGRLARGRVHRQRRRPDVVCGHGEGGGPAAPEAAGQPGEQAALSGAGRPLLHLPGGSGRSAGSRQATSNWTRPAPRPGSTTRIGWTTSLRCWVAVTGMTRSGCCPSLTGPTGRSKLLLWRSPNQLGEYVLLQPTAGSHTLAWATAREAAVLPQCRQPPAPAPH